MRLKYIHEHYVLIVNTDTAIRWYDIARLFLKPLLRSIRHQVGSLSHAQCCHNKTTNNNRATKPLILKRK